MNTVKDLLDTKGRNIWSVSPQTTAYEALQIMADKNVGALFVTEEGRLAGIFSERDYARKVILKGKSSKDTPVSALMTGKIFSTDPTHTLDDCLKMMTEHHVRHLPVLDDGKLIGMLTIGDVVKHIISRQKNAIRSLEDYITGR